MNEPSRIAVVERRTAETFVRVSLNLDGSGAAQLDTGVGFFDHMLHQLARHSRFDIELICDGDTHIDDHHTVEDVGITLGLALKDALGAREGIARYGTAFAPMDESLVMCALDISGRGYSVCELAFRTEKIGSFDTQLVPEFVRAVAHHALVTVHIRSLAGWNSHHLAEAAFKALALSLRDATRVVDRNGGVPSTKGVL